MATELEAKMRVASFDPVRRALEAAGARRMGVVRETNAFFDAPGAKLKSADCGLRLRTNRRDGSGEVEHVVTYKGPQQSGPLKNREEIETAVDDPDAIAAIFERLGYPRTLSFEKRRETWTLDGCKVELDEPEGLGTFVEIEGRDEATVMSVRQKLGLENEPIIKQSYISMIAERAR